MTNYQPSLVFEKVFSNEDIEEGQAVQVIVKGRHIVLCRYLGQLHAIDDRCTHDNGPLGEGELVDGQIECPRHGARFDVCTGRALCLPAVGAVHTYSVEVRDGSIWIGVPAGN